MQLARLVSRAVSSFTRLASRQPGPGQQFSQEDHFNCFNNWADSLRAPLLYDGQNEYLHDSQSFQQKKDGDHGQISLDKSQVSRSNDCLQVAMLGPEMPDS